MKEVLLIAEEKIRKDAARMQANIINMERRRAFERLLFHLEVLFPQFFFFFFFIRFKFLPWLDFFLSRRGEGRKREK